MTSIGKSSTRLLPPLTSATLRQEFGAHADMTGSGVAVLHRALRSASPEVLDRWRFFFGPWARRAGERAPRQLAKLARLYGVAADDDRLLFALQTYYAMVVHRVADRLAGKRDADLLPEGPFHWYRVRPSEDTEQVIRRLDDLLARCPTAACPATADGCDLFKPLYQDLFPRPLRHALGEYYTPDWLADHVLDQVGYAGDPGQRLLDPSCGSGTFLMLALRRLRAFLGQQTSDARNAPHPASLPSPLSSLPSPLSPLPSSRSSPVVGFDLNPLAVLTARANYRIATADLAPLAFAEPPIYLCDSIRGIPALPGMTEAFDYVVGNPPWIAWDNLPDEDRAATKPLWEHYGLFSLSGNAARHGGGKKDLSMLMLYATADRNLKTGGRLGMVVTQTLFQTKDAGAGFRRFRIGRDGLPLGVLRVDDMVAVRPFDDAANWTSTITLQKGVVTEYPVPYIKWSRMERDDECGMMNGECRTDVSSVEHSSLITHHSSLLIHPSPCSAYPIDPSRPTSPWRIVPETQAHAGRTPAGPADYAAHLGANSGGSNGVYWIEILGAAEDGRLRIRNTAARGKHPIAAIERAIEPALLYPLLRWSDVGRYTAVPKGHIVLAQDPETRSGIDEAWLRERCPCTLEYLEEFRTLLTARAAYRRYQGRGPFYSMYNVGPYTVAPIKVVWRRMDRRINAAVVEEVVDPMLGRRPVIPQETCVLIACESADEAHYVCAMLNSRIVGELVSAGSVRGGKGFGTPGMLQYVPLRRYVPDDPRHAALAALSRKAHTDGADDILHDIDAIATEVLH